MGERAVFPLRAAGYNPDLPPSEVPLDQWTGGQNVIFRNGETQLAPGWQPRYEPIPAEVMALHNVQVSGFNYWIYHGPNSSHVVEGQVHTNVTNGNGQTLTAEPANYSVGSLNGVSYFNNRLETPKYWGDDPSTNFEDLPGFPAGTTCRKLVGFNVHLFALGIDGPSGELPQQVLWSDAAEPGAVPSTWTPAADNQAGSVIVADARGRAQTAVNLRGSLIIYFEGSMHTAEFIGGNDVYSFRTLFSNTGALTPRSVVDVGGSHFVVTDGDVILTDGTSKQSIANRRVSNYLFNALEDNTFQRLFCVYWQAQREVWVCFPGTGATYCDTALVYDLDNDKWSTPRSLNQVTSGATGIIEDDLSNIVWDDDFATWDEDVSIWNENTFDQPQRELILGSVFSAGSPATAQGSPIGSGSPVPVRGQFWQITGTTEDETLSAGKVERYAMDFDAPGRIKFVRRLHPRLRATAGMKAYFRVGSTDTPTEDASKIEWSREVTFTVDTDEYVDVNMLENGKYIYLEMRTDEADPWTLVGIDIEYENKGWF